ncbi:MAG: FIST N-terminal domain-containing protein, partial [Acidimicrobiia bacterium]
MKMAVGQTEELDGEFAAAEVLKQCSAALDGLEPQAGLLMASHDLDHEDFLAAVANAYPDLDLIGCTTLAPMSSAGEYSEGSTTLTLFASDVLDFTTGLGTDARANIDAASRQAVEEAAAKTDKDPALLVVTPTIEHLDPTALTAQMGDVLGLTVPVFGGGASPDFPMTAPWLGGTQFSGQQVLTDSLPVLLISGPLKVSVGVAHGWG